MEPDPRCFARTKRNCGPDSGRQSRVCQRRIVGACCAPGRGSDCRSVMGSIKAASALGRDGSVGPCVYVDQALKNGIRLRPLTAELKPSVKTIVFTVTLKSA